jgi:hypothetical protein
MNKFDDMMAHLNKHINSFKVVVAVNWGFDNFYRAWCIAELVEAESSNITVSLCLHSERSFRHNYRDLMSLKVEDCQASRPEDKQEILSKISDKKSFNDRLHYLIFATDGLFSKFMDAKARLNTIGKILDVVNQPQEEEEEPLSPSPSPSIIVSPKIHAIGEDCTNSQRELEQERVEQDSSDGDWF